MKLFPFHIEIPLLLILPIVVLLMTSSYTWIALPILSKTTQLTGVSLTVCSNATIVPTITSCYY